MPLTVTTSAASNARAAIACTSGTPPYVIYGYTSNNRWLVRGNQVNSYPTTAYTFGADVTGWTHLGFGTTTWDSSTGRTVTGSLKNMYTPGAMAFLGVTTLITEVVPGEAWTTSSYVRSISTTQTVTGYLTYRTAGGVFLSQTSASVSATSSGWALLTVTGTAPATAGYASLEIYNAAVANAVSNPGAEVNLTGLAATNGSTIARSTAQFYAGTASLLMTASITGASAAAGTPRPGGGTTLPVTAGNTYGASAFVLNSVGSRRYRVRILWWNSGGGNVGDTASPTGSTTATTPATWTFISTSGVAPAGATQASVEIDAITAGAIGDAVHIDQIGLTSTTEGLYLDDVTMTSNRIIKTAYDNAVPLQLPTYYEVTDATATKVTSGPVTIDQSTPILADALYPSLNTSVVLISQKPNTWESRSVWFDVLGREDPLPVVAPLRYRNGTIKIRAAEPADRAELLSLLTTGRPLLLRQPCHNMSADDVYLLPIRVTESPIVDQYHAGPATFDIEYQAVTRDIGVEWANPRTYDTFLTESATYLILSTAWASYANAAGGAPT